MLLVGLLYSYETLSFKLRNKAKRMWKHPKTNILTQGKWDKEFRKLYKKPEPIHRSPNVAKMTLILILNI